jgi:talin
VFEKKSRSAHSLHADTLCSSPGGSGLVKVCARQCRGFGLFSRVFFFLHRQTLRFNPDMSIEEVGASIMEKTGEGDESYGLYMEGKLGVRKAKWLKADKTLQSYDLKNGEDVSWKSRNRPIKVKLMDGTIKTVMIDESSQVEYLIELIGGKIGLEKTEEYGLQIEGADKWLNNTQSLQDQGVTEHTILKFKKRYFVDDLNVDKSDPIQLHLVYLQSRDAILTGEYPVQLEEAIQFAAVQLQVEVGNYDPQVHNDKWFRRPEFLPAAHHKKANWKDISRQWEKCANMNKINAYYKVREHGVVDSFYLFSLSLFLVRANLSSAADVRNHYV